MISLLQRVSGARVRIDGETVGEIGAGLAVLVCAESGDSAETLARVIDRLLGYRVFPDGAGKMNRSLQDTGGGLLLVPQFTLGADTSSGTRPSFSSVAPPGLASSLFEALVSVARERHSPVACGVFGAHMQVELVNDGPVTFWLRTAPLKSG